MTKRPPADPRTAQLEARIRELERERDALEEQLRSAQDDEGVRRAAGRIAHDFNNLLTSIKGLSGLALKDLSDDHPNRRDLEEIERAAQRAADLTLQLLTLSREGTPDSAAAGGADEQGRAYADARGAGETILVAEDNPSIRRLVERVLRSAGYRVLAAKDGGSALELAEQQQGGIHLLLTDVVMPGMDGQELWSLVERRWSRVRVLYMSGYTDNPVVRREAENPAGAFLPKPFAPEELLAAVRRTLDREP